MLPLNSQKALFSGEEANVIRFALSIFLQTDFAGLTSKKEEEKAKDLEHAPFGIVGLETSVALTITNLVKKGHITPLQMAAKMSYNPAKVLGSNKGTLNENAVADVVVINPDTEYEIDANTFASKGKNTPFNGYKVNGQVEFTILGGKIVYENK